MATEAATSADYVNIRVDPTAFAYQDVPLPEVWTVRQKVEAPDRKSVV